MKLITTKTLTLVLTLCLTSTANATLFSRLGGDALYDDVLNITWLSNANLALANQFGLSLSTNEFDSTANTVGSTGRMSWDNANAWIAGMNSANHLGFNDWRLPTLGPINGTAFNTSFTNDGSTDRGRNISRPGTVHGGSLANEMAHLFYNSLGNVSDHNTSGVFDDGCPGGSSCLTNTGPFDNLQSDFYWSGLEFAPNPSAAWFFRFDFSSQSADPKNNNFFALAVRAGDVAAVPVPAAVWLMGSALFGLAGFRRKKAVPASP